MEHSESVTEFAAAFLAAQKEMGAAKKSAQNPHLGNKYADLAAVWDAAHEALHGHGLSVLQGVSGAPGSVTVSTMLLHVSGQWVRDSLTLPFAENRGINPCQAAGSAITYARRYGLSAMLSLPTEDDDGNSAHDAQGEGNTARQAKGTTHAAPKTENARKGPSGSSGEVSCPKCSGPMWDNRATKKNPKQPDYRCRSKECDGAIWPPRDNAPPEPTNEADEHATAVKSVLAAAGKANLTPENLANHAGLPVEELSVESLRALYNAIKAGEVLPF